eukprot:14121440-Alexandrium_andersonii.AAC.1
MIPSRSGRGHPSRGPSTRTAGNTTFRPRVRPRRGALTPARAGKRAPRASLNPARVARSRRSR